MPDNPPPGVAQDVIVAGPETVTSEPIEQILADFRRWLQDLAGYSESSPEVQTDGEAFTLQTLVSQFVALRHDIILQTKAARAQQEQASRSLEMFEQALETLQDAESSNDDQTEDAVAESLRPLLKSLLDVVDLMSVAGREVQRVRELLEKHHDEALESFGDDPATVPAGNSETGRSEQASFLRRLFGRKQRAVKSYHEHMSERRRQRDEKLASTWSKVIQLVESILAGYNMSVERLDRTLAQFGLEPIPSEGHSFDPEMMEVVDVATGSGRPGGEVIQEVRRGFQWRGRVFRYAQVKVAKS